MAGRRISTFALAACALLVALPASASAGESDTVWLCKPGSKPNPCRDTLETTVYAPDGAAHTENPPFARRPKVDCFYVYPTVSGQPGINADRSIDPEQVAIAQQQASRFSRRCRVYAPVYRQLTLAALLSASDEEMAAGAALAYADVLAAWRDYLRNHNHGRGVVLIGHSQGTYMLRYLIRTVIDPNPRLRERLVSAVLLGGNVMVADGKRAGGDFEHIRSCARPKQTGCVIAFSTYNETPPPNSRYGRAENERSGTFGLPYGDRYEVLCTNPAALRGGAAPLQTYFRTEPFPGLLGAAIALMYGGPPPSAPTPWVQPSEHYAGECVSADGANVLMLSPIGSARRLNPSPDATWGLHLADVNIALGDLVDVVNAQAKAFVKAQRKRR
jgi:hypothetical protein